MEKKEGRNFALGKQKKKSPPAGIETRLFDY